MNSNAMQDFFWDHDASGWCTCAPVSTGRYAIHIVLYSGQSEPDALVARAGQIVALLEKGGLDLSNEAANRILHSASISWGDDDGDLEPESGERVENPMTTHWIAARLVLNELQVHADSGFTLTYTDNGSVGGQLVDVEVGPDNRFLQANLRPRIDLKNTQNDKEVGR